LKSDLIRGVASFERGNIVPVVIYSISASEIWPDKRRGLWCEGHKTAQNTFMKTCSTSCSNRKPKFLIEHKPAKILVAILNDFKISRTGICLVV
jgi:hypothetical protein